jgi:hypothetical protein
LIAQLVEQRIENPRVGGSTPSQATIKYVKGYLSGCPFFFVQLSTLRLFAIHFESPTNNGLVDSYALGRFGQYDRNPTVKKRVNRERKSYLAQRTNILFTAD